MFPPELALQDLPDPIAEGRSDRQRVVMRVLRSDAPDVPPLVRIGAADPEMNPRIRAEVAIRTQLHARCPGAGGLVPEVKDEGSTEGRAWFVTPWYPETLADRIAADPDPVARLRCFARLARLLERLEAATGGLLAHNRLCAATVRIAAGAPEGLLLDDFSEAHGWGPFAVAPPLEGSAPDGETVGVLADRHALAVTVFTGLTGLPCLGPAGGALVDAFDARLWAAVCTQPAGVAVAPSVASPAVERAVAQLSADLKACLSPTPSERSCSPGMLARRLDALADALREGAPQAPPAPKAPPVWAVWVGVLSLLLLLGIFLGRGVVLAAQQTETPPYAVDAGALREQSGLRWVTVPAGTGKIGDDIDGAVDERPPFWIQWSTSFEMLETEVTNRQFARYVPDHQPINDEPVTQVSWLTASAWCREAGGRLPTELEWEYAARAGGISAYGRGERDRVVYDHELAFYAWFAPTDKVQPVRQKKPNAWGLYDLWGNAWEWTLDGYDKRSWAAYARAAGPASWGEEPVLVDPGIANPHATVPAAHRVFRGGAVGGTAWFLRSGDRFFAAAEASDKEIGFRCVNGPPRPAFAERRGTRAPTPPATPAG